MGTNAIIIGMATLTVASGVTQSILSSLGKMTESQYMDLTTKCLLGATAIGCFSKFVSSISGLVK